MKKLCYILPEFNPETDTHFAYLYDFLRAAAEKLDIFLIIEKSKGGKIQGSFKKVYCQKFKFWPLRVLELAIVLKLARLAGYKNFYVHYSYIGAVLAGLISRFSKGRSFYWNCASAWNLKQRFRSRFLLRLALKTSHFLVTGTEGLKKEYAKRYDLPERKILVMPNWINPEKFSVKTEKNVLRQKYGLPAGQKILLFVHRLSERKGADFLVPLMTKLSPDFFLLIAGQGPYGKQLVREIKEKELEKRIRILGRVPNKEIAELYQLADLFVMPSREEGFPRVILEAMAADLPYVAFETGGVREISPATAQDFVLPMGDLDKFVEKIEVLFEKQDVYNKFQQEEEKKVGNFSQEKVLNAFINLF